MKTSRRKFVKNIAGAAAAVGALGISSCTQKKENDKEDESVLLVKQPKGPAKEKYDAVVIGAGLSGLHAASLLEEAGMDVLVLEGRNRLGGRVYTLENVPGKPEAGGEFMGANYARMRSVVDKLGLETYTPKYSNETMPWMFHINGEFIKSDDWATHKFNPQKGEFRDLTPNLFLYRITHAHNPLKGQPLDAWLTPEFQKYDIPHDQFLRSVGLDEETIKLMNVVIHSNGMHRTSALNEFRRYHVNYSNPEVKFPDGTGYKKIKGGTSLVPRAMANNLRNEVLFDKTVVGFREQNNEVEISCADGTSYKADHVVCSIPISVLRNVTFDPHITGVTAQAIKEVDYGLSVGVHFEITERFWEKDGLEPSIWSDGELERIAVRDKEYKNGGDALVVYINGPESFKFRLMNDQQVFDYVLKKLAILRPSTKGVLKPLLVQSCERDIHGAGDWVFWQPGQVIKFGNEMRRNHGRIHFAGEHTAIIQRGMEGAFESGERAAFDIIMQA